MLHTIAGQEFETVLWVSKVSRLPGFALLELPRYSVLIKDKQTGDGSLIVELADREIAKQVQGVMDKALEFVANSTK